MSVKFSISTDPYWGEINQHIVKKEGSETISKAYTIQGNEIIFSSVSVEDSGTYTISCRNNAGEGSKQFKLDVTPEGNNIALHNHSMLLISLALYSLQTGFCCYYC